MAKPLNNPSNTQKRRFAKLLDEGSGVNIECIRALCELNLAGSQSQAKKQYGKDSGIYTKALDKLEKFLGFKIRIKPEGRNNSPVFLNEKGKELAKLADNFLNELDYFKNFENQVTLKIGSGGTTIESLLLPRLENLIRDLGEELCIEFKNKQTQDLFDMLANGTLDLAFFRGENVREPLACEKLIEVTFCLCYPKTFAKDFRKKDPLNILSKRPVAMMEGRGRLRRQIDDSLAKKSNHAMVRLECTSHSQILRAIASQKYCGVLPQYCVDELNDQNFIKVPLDGLTDQPFSIAWNNKDKESFSQLRKKLPNSDDYLIDRAIDAFKKIFKK